MSEKVADERGDKLLPGLEEGIRLLGRLHDHSGGVYQPYDQGWKDGVERARSELVMVANQIRGNDT